MCGIIGFTGLKNALPIILDGLSALEYRGYDSAGVAMFDEKSNIDVYKSKGRLNNLKALIKENEKQLNTSCAIGHTRWATHGEPSDANSHPHGTENLQLVHNGIIENYTRLKEKLEKSNYTFISDTDTEVAAKVIDSYYSVCNDPYESIKKAISDFEGSYAIAVIFKDYPGKIFAFRKDNPLIIAVSDHGNFVASDIPAFLKHTRKYYHIFEGEVAEITPTCVSIYNSEHEPTSRKQETASWDIEEAEKSGYAHFMLKEINEQPEAVVKTLRQRIKEGLPYFDINGLDDAKLKAFSKIHIVACGTAMHAGLVGKYAIEALSRTEVNVEIASEFRYNNPILNKNELVIVISQSGETADTLAALKLAKKCGLYTLAIVNVTGSTIAREADGVIYTHAGPEIAVASTKAYTVQVSVLYALAIHLAHLKNKIDFDTASSLTDELINVIPSKISLAMEKSEQCKSICDKYKNEQSIFYIGRGLDYALACEGSLKLKEISYIHCEAYAAGELKHGTISLISDGVPVIAISTNSKTFDKMISNIKEVSARGARVIIICKESDVTKIPQGLSCDTISVPDVSELFTAFPVAVICQLIAYHTSVLLGCDVDKPRNLAKSVTVE